MPKLLVKQNTFLRKYCPKDTCTPADVWRRTQTYTTPYMRKPQAPSEAGIVDVVTESLSLVKKEIPLVWAQDFVRLVCHEALSTSAGHKACYFPAMGPQPRGWAQNGRLRLGAWGAGGGGPVGGETGGSPGGCAEGAGGGLVRCERGSVS